QAARSAPNGSFSTRHRSSKIIVGRPAVEYRGHSGIPGWLGLPARANAIHAALIRSPSARREGEVPVKGAESRLSNTNGTSTAWGDFRRPPSIGVFYVKR